MISIIVCTKKQTKFAKKILFLSNFIFWGIFHPPHLLYIVSWILCSNLGCCYKRDIFIQIWCQSLKRIRGNVAVLFLSNNK